ncbi:juvenile hormone acid O-methyltransferase [Trichonephila inaurata madagascariensis]|uniref:Juvenile hormone acid O-methyltransferase n=1 Tax=Trichonephila inaurata madagascariensis TaxID=2747483 RepID=A0A8X7CBW2_9ARAC|nr:juvenile hormone acid O-methyltransferase [Trichonephila inaurata madagascariensis]
MWGTIKGSHRLAKRYEIHNQSGHSRHFTLLHRTKQCSWAQIRSPGLWMWETLSRVFTFRWCIPCIREEESARFSAMNDPELYSRSSPFQVRDASQILGVYKKQMSPEDTDIVLDIGCGTGDVTTKILGPTLGRFELLLGVDKSRDMVEYAQQHYNVDNIFYESPAQYTVPDEEWRRDPPSLCRSVPRLRDVRENGGRWQVENLYAGRERLHSSDSALGSTFLRVFADDGRSRHHRPPVFRHQSQLRFHLHENAKRLHGGREPVHRPSAPPAEERVCGGLHSHPVSDQDRVWQGERERSVLLLLQAVGGPWRQKLSEHYVYIQGVSKVTIHWHPSIEFQIMLA